MNKLLLGILSLFLLACSSPTPVNSQTNPLPKAEVKSEILPTPMISNSYILAEPLPGKKVKISITAKDKSLYIVNCNEFIVVSLFEKGKKDLVWGGTSNACLSQSIIIPKGATLSFEAKIAHEETVIDFASNYFVTVGAIYDSPNFPKAKQIPIEKLTSNEFKLLP